MTSLAPGASSALGSTIAFRISSALMPFRAASRFGPVVDCVFGGAERVARCRRTERRPCRRRTASARAGRPCRHRLARRPRSRACPCPCPAATPTVATYDATSLASLPVDEIGRHVRRGCPSGPCAGWQDLVARRRRGSCRARSRRASDWRKASSRFGPVAPLVPARASTWHEPHFCCEGLLAGDQIGVRGDVVVLAGAQAGGEHGARGEAQKSCSEGCGGHASAGV